MIRLAVVGETELWQSVASRLHNATVACNYATRLTQPPADCDAVIFAGPNHPESAFVIDCLAGGKHVLVSNSSLSPDDLQVLQTAARSGPAQFAVVNPDHYLPSRQLIRQHLEDGKLGAPGLVRLHRWESSATPEDSTALPTAMSGDLELVNWLVGKSPNLVYGVEASRTAQVNPAGRTLQVHLGFPDGLMALIDYSNCLPPGAGYQSLSIFGGSGAAYADDHHNGQLVYRGNHPRAVLVDEGIRKWVHLAQEFVDALLSRRDLSESVTAWRNAWDVVAAAEESLSTRRAVTLEAR